MNPGNRDNILIWQLCIVKLYQDDKSCENMYNMSAAVTNNSNLYIRHRKCAQIMRINSSNVWIIWMDMYTIKR